MEISKIRVYLRNYIYNLFVACSQILNAFLLGDPYETLSSRIGKCQLGLFGPFWKNATKPVDWFVDMVFWIILRTENHCEKAVDLTKGSNDTFNRTEII